MKVFGLETMSKTEKRELKRLIKYFDTMKRKGYYNLRCKRHIERYLQKWNLRAITNANPEIIKQIAILYHKANYIEEAKFYKEKYEKLVGKK